MKCRRTYTVTDPGVPCFHEAFDIAIAAHCMLCSE